jgi:ABC-type transport system involved in multi-copper enzyme maturation permease subunit
MNGTLVWACWRERFSRPLVIALLTVIALLGFVSSHFDKSLSDYSGLFAMVLGAGLVGRDVSSGALALLFTRPIKRSEYLLSRWLAAALAASALGVMALLAQFLILRLRGVGVTGSELLFASAKAISGDFGLAATLVFLSTLVRGIGDIGLWLLGSLLAALCASFVNRRLGEELLRLLTPRLDWARALTSQPISWFEIASYASSVTLFLALALMMINRKEISYASHA